MYISPKFYGRAVYPDRRPALLIETHGSDCPVLGANRTCEMERRGQFPELEACECNGSAAAEAIGVLKLWEPERSARGLEPVAEIVKDTEISPGRPLPGHYWVWWPDPVPSGYVGYQAVSGTPAALQRGPVHLAAGVWVEGKYDGEDWEICGWTFSHSTAAEKRLVIGPRWDVPPRPEAPPEVG